MPPKPDLRAIELRAPIPPDTGSPDPMAVAPVDPIPPRPRVQKGTHIARQPPRRGQSDEKWSSPTSRLANVGRIPVRSPEHEEEDSPGAVPARQASVDVDVRGKLDFGAASSDSDTEDAASAAMPRVAAFPDIRPPSPDVMSLFGNLGEGLPSEPPQSSPEPQIQSEDSSVEDEDAPLIPPLPARAPPCVWHSADGVGAVLVPVRDDHFPSELQDAESTMASQIASAMGDPKDEGLGSATFQTLLDAFLLPRLQGRNSKGHKVKIHQYSQFAARREQAQNAAARQDSDALARRYKLDKDDAAFLDAVARRRVPDMTAMVTFEERVITPDGRNYRLESHRGPKLCITEIKSFRWPGSHDYELDYTLSTAILRAHEQNYVAAQFLFMEDERLHHVASFMGVGPVWLYGEWSRSQYPDLHGMPLPNNHTEFKRYNERDALETPDGKKPGPPRRQRKRLRVDSPESVEDAPEQSDVDNNNIEPAITPSVRKGPNTRAVVREPDPNKVFLDRIGTTPWTAPAHIQEIFARYRPGKVVKPNDPLPYLYVLDPEGRTYEAFDAIVERIRGWYTSEECAAEYRIIFKEDPYAGGSCPATAAKAKGKARQ